VAGVAALLFALNPQLTNADVRGIIEDTADDLGDPGWDEFYGFGRANAYQAALAAQPTPTATATSTPTPTPTPTSTPVPVIAVPLLRKVQRGTTAALAIHNANGRPGWTRYHLDIYDQHGLVDSVCQVLDARGTAYVDLAELRFLPDGFIGSGVIVPVASTQAGGSRLLAIVAEVGRGSVPGDPVGGFEGVPLWTDYDPVGVPDCGK